MCISLFKQRNGKPWHYPRASLFPFLLSQLLYSKCMRVFICGFCGLGAAAAVLPVSLSVDFAVCKYVLARRFKDKEHLSLLSNSPLRQRNSCFLTGVCIRKRWLGKGESYGNHCRMSCSHTRTGEETASL